MLQNKLRIQLNMQNDKCQIAYLTKYPKWRIQIAYLAKYAKQQMPNCIFS